MIVEKRAIRRTSSGAFFAHAGDSPRRRVAHRLLAVLLLAVMSLGTASDVCQGWSSHAADRRSCCAHMENHCASWSPDDCCEKGEQRRTRDVVRAAPLPAPDMTPGTAVTPLVFVGSDDDLQALVDRPRSHLLYGVFLI